MRFVDTRAHSRINYRRGRGEDRLRASVPWEQAQRRTITRRAADRYIARKTFARTLHFLTKSRIQAPVEASDVC
jgi:hypothetical protein